LNKQKLKIILLLFLISWLVFLLQQYKTTFIARMIDRPLNYDWSAGNRLIAHALGGYQGYTYTNSPQAFKYNYNQGLRVFEIDLLLDENDRLIALHEPNEQSPKEQDQGIFNKIEPINLAELKRLMKQYPDSYFVIDTKEKSMSSIIRVYSELMKMLKADDPELISKIIPQLYNTAMLKRLEEVHPFNSYIFTLYRTGMSDEQVIKFVSINNIKAVTMSESRFNEQFVDQLNEISVKSYLHTINDKKLARKYL